MRGTPITYFQALNRLPLILGVERRLFFMLLAIASLLILTSLFKPLMLVIGGLLFFACLNIGRLLTKSDIAFLLVYQRHLRYQRSYEPMPHLLGVVGNITASVPRFSGAM